MVEDDDFSPDEPESPVLARLVAELLPMIQKFSFGSREVELYIAMHRNDHEDFLRIVSVFRKHKDNPRIRNKPFSEADTEAMQELDFALLEYSAGFAWKMEECLRKYEKDELLYDFFIAERLVIDSYLKEGMTPPMAAVEDLDTDDDPADWWK